ncbi:VOC family protein [Limnobaculum xujianqingii]|uniref:VOC family protein n=1 Tax=Limnobaculum xujianqingii TaxID=2738837 RepID=UPI00112C890F|nr:VOC family protein [Limnobaculum xujianqingii]
MTVKAQALAWIMYQATDLSLMQKFMTDFGLFPVTVANQRDDILYLRGSSKAPVIHATRKGDENRFLGLGVTVASEDDLHQLTDHPGASGVEHNPMPGGGLQVRLQTPDGIEICAIYGAEPAVLLPFRDPHLFNSAFDKPRVNASIRARPEIVPVLSLGHCVLRVSSCEQSTRWFEQTLGMIVSDYICTPDERPVGAFMRFDHGDVLVDHHSLLINEAKEIGVHHCGFEMQDIDSIHAAHDYLVSQGYQLECGVGRHLLGSQIYDYWMDPFGNRVEHYTDGDVVNHHHQPTRFCGSAEGTTQWGMKVPPSFFE